MSISNEDFSIKGNLRINGIGEGTRNGGGGGRS